MLTPRQPTWTICAAATQLTLSCSARVTRFPCIFRMLSSMTWRRQSQRVPADPQTRSCNAPPRACQSLPLLASGRDLLFPAVVRILQYRSGLERRLSGSVRKRSWRAHTGLPGATWNGGSDAGRSALEAGLDEAFLLRVGCSLRRSWPRWIELEERELVLLGLSSSRRDPIEWSSPSLVQLSEVTPCVLPMPCPAA